MALEAACAEKAEGTYNIKLKFVHKKFDTWGRDRGCLEKRKQGLTLMQQCKGFAAWTHSCRAFAVEIAGFWRGAHTESRNTAVFLL